MARIDKYLWAVRLFKTRSLAANMVKAGKVLVDGEEVKTAYKLKVGQQFSVKKNTAVFHL
jgi:ribosome-associated heat shock protein Hsp15